jgi:hypothetical protein
MASDAASAKLKHDQFVDAFHSRLSTIKNNVSAINTKLDKVQKK